MSPSRAALALIASLTIAAPLLAGPPWITVELPPNPFDPATRGALFVVRVFHYRSDGDGTPTGRAIGLVDGQRRTATVTLTKTGRPGYFAVKNTWGDRGEWSVVVTATQEHDNVAEALVKVSGQRVVGVEVATGPSRHAELPVVPRRFTDAEVEASLRDRVGN